MQAMILAAGFGTRLHPFTNIRPKPLFPILNIPLLLLTIQRLKDAGCDHIVVNCHHLKDQVRDYIGGIQGVHLQEEKKILGTGGGLRLALERLRDEPILITNGDIYHSVDYQAFYKNHLGSGSKLTLAVHDYPRFNGLTIEAGRLVSFDRNHQGDVVAFTGLHILHPQLLKPLSLGKKSCIIKWYKTLLENGEMIGVYRVDNCFWTDMGTPEDYLQLHGDLLKRRVDCWRQLKDRVATPTYLSRAARTGRNLEVREWACIGKAQIGDNVSISRSVIWDGVVIPDNSVIADSLIV